MCVQELYQIFVKMLNWDYISKYAKIFSMIFVSWKEQKPVYSKDAHSVYGTTQGKGVIFIQPGFSPHFPKHVIHFIWEYIICIVKEWDALLLGLLAKIKRRNEM